MREATVSVPWSTTYTSLTTSSLRASAASIFNVFTQSPGRLNLQMTAAATVARREVGVPPDLADLQRRVGGDDLQPRAPPSRNWFCSEWQLDGGLAAGPATLSTPRGLPSKSEATSETTPLALDRRLDADPARAVQRCQSPRRTGRSTCRRTGRWFSWMTSRVDRRLAGEPDQVGPRSTCSEVVATVDSSMSQVPGPRLPGTREKSGRPHLRGSDVVPRCSSAGRRPSCRRCRRHRCRGPRTCRCPRSR